MDSETAPLTANVGGAYGNHGFLTGVILREKLSSFERVLCRATRGNLFMKQLQFFES